jgi:hypothetical protein
MNNPYQSSKMRRMKHRNRLLYLLVSPFLWPQWLLSQLSRLLKNHTMGVRVEEFFFTLSKPLRAVAGFFNSWSASRPWKQLWFASPVLIVALIGFTVFFINANRNRGRAYGGYYQGALKAMGEGDYKKADSLFSKLIHHPSYKDNDQVLFRALIAASANGNVTRARALREKLIVEREYEPAKRWVVSNSIQRGAMKPEEAETLVVMARNMVEQAPDASYAGYWRLSLARILMSQSKAAAALEVLEAEDGLAPEGRLLLAQVHAAAGDAENAKQVLRDLVAFLDLEDPHDAQYIRERVEGMVMLSGLTEDLEGGRALLERALVAIERKRKLSSDRRVYDAWAGEVRIRLFKVLLRMNNPESRLLAFEHFDNAIAAATPPYRAGEMLNGLVDVASGYSLLSGQMLEVLVNAGGSGAHLAMAMDAWVGGDKVKAKLHVGLSNSVSPSSLIVLRSAATASAKGGSADQLDFNIFQGDNKSSYQKSLDLLDLIVEVDFKQSINVAFDKCYIYSLRKNWRGIIDLMQPHLSELDGQQLLQAYDWLVRAHTQLDEKKAAAAYQRIMLDEVRKLREN